MNCRDLVLTPVSRSNGFTSDEIEARRLRLGQRITQLAAELRL
jgi:hypothetical protein